MKQNQLKLELSEWGISTYCRGVSRLNNGLLCISELIHSLLRSSWIMFH